MVNAFQIGQCLICHQGMLELVKEKSSGKIIVLCDECEAEWERPDDALKNRGGTRGKYGKVTAVTLEEICDLGWDQYLS